MSGYHRITLRCPQGHTDPYGYGLRVVGQHVGDIGEDNGYQQQDHERKFARILWLSPGGVAESAGMNVGDRVCIFTTSDCHFTLLKDFYFLTFVN